MQRCFARCVNYVFLDAFAQHLQEISGLQSCVLHHPVAAVHYEAALRIVQSNTLCYPGVMLSIGVNSMLMLRGKVSTHLSEMI